MKKVDCFADHAGARESAREWQIESVRGRESACLLKRARSYNCLTAGKG